jgi:hypothetical protein
VTARPGTVEDMNESHDAVPHAAETPTLARVPATAVWSLRRVAAVAVTAVALSGIGGAALAAASDQGSDGGRTGPGGFGGPPGMTNGGARQPPAQTGRLAGPGATPPVGAVPGQSSGAS